MSSRRAGCRLPEQILYHGDLALDRITLGEAESLHAVKSLRLRIHDPVVLTDGRGTWARGSVAEIEKKRLHVAVETREVRVPWPGREIWMGVGVLKSHRMDVMVEKASELGVSRFFPLVLQRSVARPHERGAKEDRWQRIALESLKQCRRSHLMSVEAPGTLDSFLGRVPRTATLWVGEPGGKAPGTIGCEGPLALVVGPEGGLDPSEIERLQESGGVCICLGNNRLRAETAGMALLVAALGRLHAFDAGYGADCSNP